MSKRLIEEISSNGVVVVFDVDGVLAPYEWGFRKHCMSNEEWTAILESGEDMYSHIKPIKCMQEFIKNKRIEDVFVCSKSEKAEYESKKNFCIREYGILEDHIKLVEHKSDKVLFLDELALQLNIFPSKLAIVEDTVETLNKIANTRDYCTVHVSSFFEEGEKKVKPKNLKKYRVKELEYIFDVEDMIIEGEDREGGVFVDVIAEDIVRLNKDIMSSDDIDECLSEGDDFVWDYRKRNLELIED